MTPEQRQRIEAVFEAALDLEPAERRDLVERECADDPLVRREVLALLAASDREGILDSNPTGLAASLIEAYQPGARLGPYRLISEIGRGGMGVVYLAARDDGQFHRSVAIKVVRAGADPGEVQRRLEAERQILASLDHPNIARLFDGGVTVNGQPYLVMEYIEGLPLDQYCDEERLSIEERLELFATVARAVHYAHRRLVVHRDLKPTNILVTPDGQPKLLDFGIAKILEQSPLEDAAPLTRTGLRLLTPEYASPEQVRGAPVTTSNDIYALGIILHELLTGRRPFNLREKTAGEAERVILWQDAQRPGSLFTKHGDDDTSSGTGWTADLAAAARRSNPARLARRLNGDLDRIVLMALRKEPERRYSSAEQLADDIDRHLEGRPVIARSDSAAYRARKFVERHRWGVLAASLIAIVLIGGIVATTTQARRASAQRARAEEEAEKSARVASVMMDLFRLSDPNETLGDTVTARQMLDRGTDRILREFGDQPAVQADMLSEVAHVYTNLGLLSRAEPLVRQALDIRVAEFGASSLQASESLLQLGEVLAAAGKRSDAVAPFRESIAIREDATPQPDSLTAAAEVGLAWELRALGNHDEAADLFSRALDKQRALHGDFSPAVATTMLGLASSLHDNGRFDEAEALFQRALANRDGLEQAHPMAALALLNVGLIRRIREQYLDALPLLEAALTMRRALYDEEHPLVLEAVSEYAIVLEHIGRYGEAEQLQRDGLATSLRVLGEEHPRSSSLHEALALTLTTLGHYEEALQHLDASIAAKRVRFDGDHAQIEYALIQSAYPLVYLGRSAEAARRLDEAIAMGQRLSGDRHVFKMLALREQASIEIERGRADAALPLLDEALSIGTEMLRPTHRYTLSVQRERANALILLGRAGEAVAVLEQIRAADETSLPSPHPTRGETLHLLGRAYLETGDAASAEQVLRRALDQMAALPVTHWSVGEARSLLGAALAAQGRTAEARPLLEEGLATIRTHLGPESSHTRDAQARLAPTTGS